MDGFRRNLRNALVASVKEAAQKNSEVEKRFAELVDREHALLDFHYCDRHDCETHGNWADGRGEGDAGDGSVAPVPPKGGRGRGKAAATEEGIEGNTRTGRPLPKSIGGVPIRDWLKLHGISEEVAKTRGYVGFERTPRKPDNWGSMTKKEKDAWIAANEDPVLAEQAVGQSLQDVKNVADQNSGVLIPRSPIPGSPWGPIDAQVRPSTGIISRAARGDINKALAYNAQAPGWTEGVLVGGRLVEKDGTVKLVGAKKTDISGKKLSELTPQEYRSLSTAQRHALLLSERLGVPLNELPRSFNELTDEQVKPLTPNDVFGSKYLFPSGTNTQFPPDREIGWKGLKQAKRVELNPDPVNVENFMNGTGRVYIALEGNLKADALVTAIKERGLGESVISVPSVTLWATENIPGNVLKRKGWPEELGSTGPNGNPGGELTWVVKNHLQGREVVIVADADAVDNDAVRNQSNAIAARLLSQGAGRVVFAAPPLDADGHVIKGVATGIAAKPKEDLKGVDDYLGAGKLAGVNPTLDKLAYTDRRVPDIKLDPATLSNKDGKVGLRVDALANVENTLKALSRIAGPIGVARLGRDALGGAIGRTETAAEDSINLLVQNGLIKKQKASVTDRNSPEYISMPELRNMVRNGVLRPPIDPATRKPLKLPTAENWTPEFEKTFRDLVSRPPKENRYVVEATDEETGETRKRINTVPSQEAYIYTILNEGHRSQDLGTKSLGEIESRQSDGVRRVATAEGAAFFGLPIGAVIPPADTREHP